MIKIICKYSNQHPDMQLMFLMIYSALLLRFISVARFHSVHWLWWASWMILVS